MLRGGDFPPAGESVYLLCKHLGILAGEPTGLRVDKPVLTMVLLGSPMPAQ